MQISENVLSVTAEQPELQDFTFNDVADDVSTRSSPGADDPRVVIVQAGFAENIPLAMLTV